MSEIASLGEVANLIFTDLTLWFSILPYDLKNLINKIYKTQMTEMGHDERVSRGLCVHCLEQVLPCRAKLRLGLCDLCWLVARPRINPYLQPTSLRILPASILCDGNHVETPRNDVKLCDLAVGRFDRLQKYFTDSRPADSSLPSVGSWTIGDVCELEKEDFILASGGTDKLMMHVFYNHVLEPILHPG